MRFAGTAFFVTDVLATVDFYERAFGLRRRYVHPSNEYAELALGESFLAFTGERLIAELGLIGSLEARPNRPNLAPIAVEIAFVTEAIEDVYEHAIAAGAVPVKLPTPMPWGQTICVVRDLNGALIEIASQGIR
jgi:lactoylglutathione lyase